MGVRFTVPPFVVTVWSGFVPSEKVTLVTLESRLTVRVSVVGVDPSTQRTLKPYSRLLLLSAESTLPESKKRLLACVLLEYDVDDQ